MSTKEHKSLAAAICAIMADVKNVGKSGENKFHGYKYASEVDLLFAVQPACAEHGIIIFPSRQTLSVTEVAPKKSGAKQWLSTIEVEYTVLHSDSGQSIAVKSIGSGIDGEDKGAYKAQTGALKYALRQLFLIPTGDDPDQDDRNDSRQDYKSEVERIVLADSDDVARLYSAANKHSLPANALDEFILQKMSKTASELSKKQIDVIISKLSSADIQDQIHAMNAG